jgi:hypothetical protein
MVRFMGKIEKNFISVLTIYWFFTFYGPKFFFLILTSVLGQEFPAKFLKDLYTVNGK